MLVCDICTVGLILPANIFEPFSDAIMVARNPSRDGLQGA
jgi:hypothetical protein